MEICPGFSCGLYWIIVLIMEISHPIISSYSKVDHKFYTGNTEELNPTNNKPKSSKTAKHHIKKTSFVNSQFIVYVPPQKPCQPKPHYIAKKIINNIQNCHKKIDKKSGKVELKKRQV